MGSMAEFHSGRSVGRADKRWVSLLLIPAEIVDTLH
jgi:hypothetical protein